MAQVLLFWGERRGTCGVVGGLVFAHQHAGEMGGQLAYFEAFGINNVPQTGVRKGLLKKWEKTSTIIFNCIVVGSNIQKQTNKLLRKLIEKHHFQNMSIIWAHKWVGKEVP